MSSFLVGLGITMMFGSIPVALASNPYRTWPAFVFWGVGTVIALTGFAIAP